MSPDPGGPARTEASAVDLWTLPERLVPEFVDRAGGPAAVLDPQERARHARKRSSGGRRRFLGGRLLCRLALSARTGLPPTAWRFAATRHGRPELDPGHHGLRFNVSHTEGLIACVVAREHACGVDVESVPFDDDKARLLSARFDDAQRAALAGAPDPVAALEELWVLTEAYLKGVGTGLANGVGALRFTRRPGGTGLVVTDGRRPGAGRRWHLDLVRPGPGHLLAVAVDDGGAGGLRRHDLVDAGSFPRGAWPAAPPAAVSL
ncbi:4'-phosphopantetheinyl transferase superfamily protein [Streptomyces sp. NPDC005907]|uniref:4'-phosphopantetheinyl transferase family protein n=1 Tax=Streptomyces sp. NPDC005907 TaxID=3154571 RepID=UPI003400396B